MQKALYYLIASPVMIPCKITSFVVWEIFSGPGWKRNHLMRSNPAKHWQEEAIDTVRKLREQQGMSQRREDELHARYRKQIEEKERQISHLRSILK
jgi:hypothetical protein